MRLINTLMLILFSLLAISSRAADLNQVKQLIARDMNGILSDTVNEGEGSAYVSENADGTPAVDCSVRASKKEPGKTLYFCSLQFDVKLGEDYEEETRSCRITYSIVNEDTSTLTANEDQEQDCIENLSTE